MNIPASLWKMCFPKGLGDGKLPLSTYGLHSYPAPQSVSEVPTYWEMIQEVGELHICTSSCPHGAKMTPQGQKQTSTKTFLTPEVCGRYLRYAPKSLSLQSEQGYYVRLPPAMIQVSTARSSALCFVRRLPGKIINSFLSQKTLCSMQMKANCSGVNHLTCHWAKESFWR